MRFRGAWLGAVTITWWPGASRQRATHALPVEAAQFDHECVDARVMLAAADFKDPEDLIEELGGIVDIGARQLGRKFIAEHRGRLYGPLEARPYMRARYALVEAYARAEHPEAAIEEAELLLVLDRQDHLGIRYRLLGLYLERGLVRKVRGVFRRHGHEHTATFAWALVLERLFSDAVADAGLALQRARGINPCAEPYLAGRRRTPKTRPETAAFGSEGVAAGSECGRFAWIAISEDRPLRTRNDAAPRPQG
jgi:hypothetical protein